MRQAVRAPRSRRHLFAALVLAAIVGLLVTSCSDGHREVRSIPAAGWPQFGGTGGNTNWTPVTAAQNLKLTWSRHAGGAITSALSVNAHGEVGVTTATSDGCNTFLFDSVSGRKQWCKKMAFATNGNTLAFDQNGQPFIGEAGVFLAFNGGGNIRWRAGTVGVPMSAKFAGPGQILTVTSQGQVLLLNAQTGDSLAPEVRLRADAKPDDPRFGFADCATGGPLCGVSAPPAVDTSRARFFLNFTPVGTTGGRLSAMGYSATDGERSVREQWTAEVGGGMMGAPSLSVDGATVYAFGRDGRLYAFNADDGAPRWNYDLGGVGFASLSVSPDGVLIPTGDLASPLTVLRDTGSKAEQVAKNTDVKVVSLAAQTGTDTAWAVVRASDAGSALSLVEVSTADGSVKRTLELPGATGFTTGVVISSGGNVTTATNAGEVFYFSPN
ncbi:MAG: PQQ-binding-like beta-propeller repeat protein [Gordonia sp. (in: high G+C Gram-positive bacteria)]|uniref:outer membrane protein assembly factor BamB family protein n=1 Tax=Gordonia sp. (in: high G+C Gram-positive bacteria) TaxID=84139 RepID=UPI003BB6334A